MRYQLEQVHCPRLCMAVYHFEMFFACARNLSLCNEYGRYRFINVLFDMHVDLMHGTSVAEELVSVNFCALPTIN